MTADTIVQHPIETFLATLRAATAPMHAALEAAPLSAALLHDHVTAADYATYLYYMRDVIFFCEQHVFPIIETVLTGLPRRRKLHLIEADLAHIPAPVHSTNSYHPFSTASVAFALGYMYVIEGSTLGGRVLLKHLAPKLAVDEKAGAAFFAGYGKETAAEWKAFLQQFGMYITAHNSERDAITGAQLAFTSIARHFDKYPN